MIASSLTINQILTHDNDIMEAIKQPTGYAIYASLYRIRDPDKWQRVFEPKSAPTQKSSVQTLSQLFTMLHCSFRWMIRKAGRALRFMLAVPENKELKTNSSRHTHLDRFGTYESHAGILSPAIPLQLLQRPEPALPHPHPDRSDSSFSKTDNEAPSSTDNARPSKVWNAAAFLSSRTSLTGDAVASSPPTTSSWNPIARGYDQDAFVTVLNPSALSSRRQHRVVVHGVKEIADEIVGGDRESEITVWPQSDL